MGGNDPRDKRFAGSLGIHYEGTPPEWQPYHGLSKLDYEEGVLHFDTLTGAKLWLQIKRLHFVHNSHGLVVGWKRDFDTNALKVEVWQFYIGGEKPDRMASAQNDRIDLDQIQMDLESI